MRREGIEEKLKSSDISKPSEKVGDGTLCKKFGTKLQLWVYFEQKILEIIIEIG